MIVNLCQLDWAAVPRYLFKYSGCFCKDIFWMRLILKSMDFEESRLLFMIWWASSSKVEDLTRTETASE